MLWGTDWPHSGESTKPDDARLLDQTARWIPDPARRNAMLVDQSRRPLLEPLNRARTQINAADSTQSEYGPLGQTLEENHGRPRSSRRADTARPDPQAVPARHGPAGRRAPPSPARLGVCHRALAQETPVKGGIFNFNLTATPPNFDPLSNSSGTVLSCIAPCYSGLVRFDPLDPNAIIPDAAKEWTVSDDGKTYTFTLFDNIRFHDGKPLTSADVAFSLDRVRNPPEGVASNRQAALERDRRPSRRLTRRRWWSP